MASYHPLAGRAVQRMNGAGNTILVLDLRGSTIAPAPADVRAMNAAPGLDFDQLMTLADPKSPSCAAFVTIFNNDGSLAEACGNGTRCVADRLCRELDADALRIETEAGPIACERLGEWSYRIDMGRPRFAWADIPISCPVRDTAEVSLPWPEGNGFGRLGPASLVNMGNPHAVFFVPDLDAVDAAAAGPRIERHPLFPERTNVTFAEVLARDAVRARVWERGVGLTLACGSAACATVVAASRRGVMGRAASVRLPGGELAVEWLSQDDHVLMTGPVEFEREILLSDAVFRAPAL